MLYGLRTHGLVVEDLAAAKRWYTEVLGHGPYFDEPFYVGFDVGGYELGLQPREADQLPPAPGRTVTYWAVPDADGALERLVSLGATLVAAAQDVGGGIRLGTVHDPFGNALGVIDNPHFRADVGARIAAAGDDLSDRTVVHEIRVARPPAEVFRLWTTAEGLHAWLMPDVRVDLRVGGPFELYFLKDSEPRGRWGSEECRFLAYLPPRLLTFTWNAPPHLKTRDAKTWVVVEFTEIAGGTHVRLTHAGWPKSGLADPASDWPATVAYFESAWGMMLGALGKHCGVL